jgi:outer membrane protein TolC
MLAALTGAQALVAQEGQAGVDVRARAVGLQEAIEVAVRRNPQLSAARYALDEAEEQVSEAWGNVMPSMNLSSNYTRNVSPAVNFLPAIVFDPDADPDEFVGVQFAADNSWAFDLNVEQPLFNAAAFIGVGASGRFRALQEETVRGELHATVTRVREAYYALLLAQEQVRLTENSVQRVRQTLAETRALNEAGLASEYDVLRLDVELANLEPNLRRARNAVRQARRQLGIELGASPEESESLRVKGSLAAMELDDPAANTPENRAILSLVEVELPDEGLESSLVRDAVGSRADLRSLELTEDLRRTELRLEQVEYLPKVSLFGTYSINAQQNGSPDFFGQPRAYARFVGVQVTMPVFQGFQRDARADQKRAALRRAQAETALGRHRAVAEIHTLVEQSREARQRAVAQGMAVAQAERGFEIASAEYREGLVSQLQLTDAEVALRQSEFNYAQAIYDFLVARARLDNATGRVPVAAS